MNNTPEPSATSGAVSAVVLAGPARRTELRQLCRDLGYAVTVASDAYAAAVSLLTDECDVLIVDLGSPLPGRSGLMAMAARYRIPVVDSGDTGDPLGDLSRWIRPALGAGRPAAPWGRDRRNAQPAGEDTPQTGDVLTSDEVAALLKRDV